MSYTYHRPLGKKQVEDNEYWAWINENIESIVTRPHMEELVEASLQHAGSILSSFSNPAYAWSGGKDSQALRGLCESLGVTRCVMGMSNLEYPEFLRWATDHMPTELEIVCNDKLDLDWLSQNLDMLFPMESKTAAKWFKLIQHHAQDQYYNAHYLDVIILGRRRQDGNYTGADGTGFYTNKKGVSRLSPIKDWTHEEILAYCHYYGYSLAPFYFWPNGFVVGTGAWAARQWTSTVENAWSEIWQIDQSVVIEAAYKLDSAQDFLRKKGY